MHTFDAIEQRRSVKNYDPAHKLTETEINKLLSLAVMSPTAYNIQNWRFVVVQDPELRKEIREASFGQAQVTDASLLVILCADTKSWQKKPERYWKNADQNVQDFVLPLMHGYYDNKLTVQRDEAMRSCGIAAQTLMLSAKAMGYDSVPMDGFDFDKVAEIINLPNDHIISMFVAIGKSIKPAYPRGGQLPLNDVVIHDRFE